MNDIPQIICPDSNLDTRFIGLMIAAVQAAGGELRVPKQFIKEVKKGDTLEVHVHPNYVTLKLAVIGANMGNNIKIIRPL